MFISLFELFPAFICAYNIASQVNSLFEVNVYIPSPSFTSLLPSSNGMSDNSTNSSLSIDSS